MTFCVGIKVEGGLVALADTRIVRGSEQVSKSKVSSVAHAGGNLFLMTSGLRSIRDKTCTYFEEQLEIQGPDGIARAFQAANLFGQQLRRVRDEDGPALEDAGFKFNLHAILGGRLKDDGEPQLFYLYPEGNWVEATVDAPYHMIGRTSYGKPILDRLLEAGTPLDQAISLAFLAFDATRTSVTDVDFPLDVVVVDSATGKLHEKRFDAQSLAGASAWWELKLRRALAEFPVSWARELSIDHEESKTWI
jgi:putative proteasome-type protease